MSVYFYVRSYLLQAESEDDLMCWVNTFEAAKRDVFLQQHLPRHPEPEEPYSPMVPDSTGPSFSFSSEDLAGAQEGVLTRSNGDAEESNALGLGLSWAASVPGVSLLLGSYAGTGAGPSKSATEPSETTADKTTELESQATDQGTSASGSEMIKSDSKPWVSIGTARPTSSASANVSPVVDTESPPHIRCRSAGDNSSVVHDQTAGHGQQQSEIEKLMKSSHHLVPKATPLPVSEYACSSCLSCYEKQGK